MKLRRLGLLVAVVSLLLTGSGSGQEVARKSAAACSRASLKDSVMVDGFEFRTYRNLDDGDACLLVLKNGKSVFRRTMLSGGEYTLGQAANNDDHVPGIANGTDITGRGHPDMVVTQWSGGAHCCFADFVFELEPIFRLVATLDAEHSDLAHFANLDGNPRYYFLAYDYSLAYWRASFAESPVAPIVLQFVDHPKGGSYHLALDKMQKQEPDADHWKTSVDESRAIFAQPDWQHKMGPLWQNVMGLIYTGHSDGAWKFLDEAWPGAIPGKRGILREFCSHLEASPYWGDLKSFVEMPPACAGVEPRPVQFGRP